MYHTASALELAPRMLLLVLLLPPLLQAHRRGRAGAVVHGAELNRLSLAVGRWGGRKEGDVSLAGPSVPRMVMPALGAQKRHLYVAAAQFGMKGARQQLGSQISKQTLLRLFGAVDMSPNAQKCRR